MIRIIRLDCMCPNSRCEHGRCVRTPVVCRSSLARGFGQKALRIDRARRERCELACRHASFRHARATRALRDELDAERGRDLGGDAKPPLSFGALFYIKA